MKRILAFFIILWGLTLYGQDTVIVNIDSINFTDAAYTQTGWFNVFQQDDQLVYLTYPDSLKIFECGQYSTPGYTTGAILPYNVQYTYHYVNTTSIIFHYKGDTNYLYDFAFMSSREVYAPGEIYTDFIVEEDTITIYTEGNANTFANFYNYVPDYTDGIYIKVRTNTELGTVQGRINAMIVTKKRIVWENPNKKIDYNSIIYKTKYNSLNLTLKYIK